MSFLSLFPLFNLNNTCIMSGSSTDTTRDTAISLDSLALCFFTLLSLALQGGLGGSNVLVSSMRQWSLARFVGRMRASATQSAWFHKNEFQRPRYEIRSPSPWSFLLKTKKILPGTMKDLSANPRPSDFRLKDIFGVKWS